MSILHLSYSASARDGGIASAVAELLRAQNVNGLNAAWLTADRYPIFLRDRLLSNSVKTKQSPLVHIHGLWRSPTRIASGFERVGIPHVIAPHGMLNPLALSHSRWKKLIAWQLWEHSALKTTSCLHALSEAEASHIRNLLPQAVIAVIPNAVNVPCTATYEQIDSTIEVPWQSVIPYGQKILLFLGRFHSGKGIYALLNAWQSLAIDAERHGWWLVFIGYGDDGELERRLANLSIRRCTVLGPAFGAAKQAALTSAQAFVLPSYFEALPMAALEAMANRLPCLLSTACNLPQAFTAGAALLAEPETKDLANSIQQLFSLSPADRTAMGIAGQELVFQHFSWNQVADQTSQLYSWILHGGGKPGFVEVA